MLVRKRGTWIFRAKLAARSVTEQGAGAGWLFPSLPRPTPLLHASVAGSPESGRGGNQFHGLGPAGLCKGLPTRCSNLGAGTQGEPRWAYRQQGKQERLKTLAIFFRKGSGKSWSRRNQTCPTYQEPPMHIHMCTYINTSVSVEKYLYALAFSTRWKLSKQNRTMFFSTVMCLLMLMKNFHSFPPPQKRLRTRVFLLPGETHCQLPSIYLQNS